MDKEKFSKWLNNQLIERGWTQAELSRRSGVSTGQIARLMTGERGIGEQSVVAIANALRLPPAQVFEAAGILPAKQDNDPWVEKMNHKMKILDNQNRVFLEKILDSMIEEPQSAPATKKARSKA